MKFLLTGSIRSDKGPRLIITFALAFLALFAAAHGVREISSVGFFPEDIAQSIRGSENAPPSKSLVLLLEDIHIELVLFSMTVLFLGSLLFQAQLRPGAKRTWIAVTSGAALIYPASKLLVLVSAPAALFVSVSGVFLHVTLVSVILVILSDLYGRRAHDLEAAQDRAAESGSQSERA